MDMQFVFGNPKRVKKNVAGSKKHGTIKRKESGNVKKRTHNPKHSKRRHSRKNPAAWYGYRAGAKKAKKTSVFETRGEVSALRQSIEKARMAIKKEKATRKPAKKGTKWTKGGKLRKKLARGLKKKRTFIKGLKSRVAGAAARESKAIQEAKQMRAEGYSTVLRHVEAKVAKKKHKKAKKAKKHVKRHTKRHVKKHAKKHVKRHTKRHVKRHAKRHVKKHAKRRHAKRRSYRTLKAHRSIRFQVRAKGVKRPFRFSLKRLNPFGGGMNIQALIKSNLGMEASVLGGLALGGALYSFINKGFLKIPGVSGIWTKALAVPFGVGSVLVPALPNAVIGVALTVIGKMKKIPVMEMIGQGIVGSVVVGLGVSASALIAKKAGMAGVDYTPMSGVDYTPMSGSEDFGSDADYGADADYGELPEGLQGLPEGLGEGQMG